MKRWIIIILVLAAAGGGTYYYFNKHSKTESGNEPLYEFGKIERKTVLNMVSATGTLSARDIVEVGTQVSGRLTEVLADFNDHVEEGQLIAMVDPSVLDISVMSQEADLMRMQAMHEQAVNDLERFKPVHEGGFLSDKEMVRYEIAVKTAEANVLSAEAGLRRAQQSRSYAEIIAPISGIVIDRTIEPGQTVAASLNAPRLFTIANDLSKMEILANVDESDIGQILDGQAVRFTVATYMDETFTGTVEEIRLQPQYSQGVVNYTVVVNAENPNGKLLPGMTATLDFIIEEVEDALAVPSGALNLQPNEEMMAVMQKLRDSRRAQREAGGGSGEEQRTRPEGAEGRTRPQGGDESTAAAGGGRPGGFGGAGGAGGFTGPGGAGGGARGNMSIIWYFEDGELKFMPVRKGVSDGVNAEVLALRDQEIPEGLEIITKVKSPSSSASQQGFGSGGPGGGPGGGLSRLGF